MTGEGAIVTRFGVTSRGSMSAGRSMEVLVMKLEDCQGCKSSREDLQESEVQEARLAFCTTGRRMGDQLLATDASIAYTQGSSLGC